MAVDWNPNNFWSRPTNYEEILNYMANHPNEVPGILEKFPTLRSLWENYQARQQYDRGEIDAQGLLDVYSSQPNVSMTPDQEKWLDNEIARENTIQQQNYELHARDTSLLSSGQQLQQLGLSPSNIISVGGASAGVQGSSANNMTRSNSALRQQMTINKYNQQMGLAKSLIGAASSMASSGIYGAALGAVKHSAQAIAGSAAHSGLAALKATQQKIYDRSLNGKFEVDENGLLKI